MHVDNEYEIKEETEKTNEECITEEAKGIYIGHTSSTTGEGKGLVGADARQMETLGPDFGE